MVILRFEAVIVYYGVKQNYVWPGLDSDAAICGFTGLDCNSLTFPTKVSGQLASVCCILSSASFMHMVLTEHVCLGFVFDRHEWL